MKKRAQAILEYILLLSLVSIAFVSLEKTLQDAITLCIKNIGLFWSKK